jgi:hypothetical protein
MSRTPSEITSPAEASHTLDPESTNDEIADDEDFKEGDFELVTTDHVRFRIPSHYLFAHR